MAARYSSPTRRSSPIRLPPLANKTTPVPQTMDLCSFLKWMTDRDTTARVEGEEEVARQRVEGEQQRQEDSARFEALLARLANTPLTPPFQTSPRTGIAPGLTSSGVVPTTSTASSSSKTAVHPPLSLATDVTFQNLRVATTVEGRLWT